MQTKLQETELANALKTIPDWQIDHGELVKTIVFPDFMQAIDFVHRVAAFAESANHHPDIDIRYNKVRLALITHDSGGITQKDIDLAKSIDTARPH